MSLVLASSIGRYSRYYVNFLSNSWANMTPSQYGVLLISVAVFGYILMKSGMKR